MEATTRLDLCKWQMQRGMAQMMTFLLAFVFHRHDEITPIISVIGRCEPIPLDRVTWYPRCAGNLDYRFRWDKSGSFLWIRLCTSINGILCFSDFFFLVRLPNELQLNDSMNRSSRAVIALLVLCLLLLPNVASQANRNNPFIWYVGNESKCG